MSSPQRKALFFIVAGVLVFLLLVGVNFGKGFYVGFGFAVAWALLAAVAVDLTR